MSEIDNIGWEHAMGEADEWFAGEVDAAFCSLYDLRLAAGLCEPDGRFVSLDLEGAAVAAGIAEVARLEGMAWALLQTPDERTYNRYGYEGPAHLESAQTALHRAWRIIAAAIRSTRCLRARMGLALSLFRIGILRARITAHRSPAPNRTPSGWSRAGIVADVFQSLTQAAHAPPRVALNRCPAIAGGVRL